MTTEQKTINKIFNHPIVYRILSSHAFLLLQAVVGSVAFITDNTDLAVYFFISIIIINFVFQHDLTPSVAPFLMISMSMIKNYGASVDDFIWYIFIAAILVLAIIFHFIIFPPKRKAGKQYGALIAVTLALMLGGVGVITAEEYFTGQNIYYLFGLGLMLIFCYVIFLNSTFDDAFRDPAKTLARAMLYVGLMGVAMIASVAVPSLLKGEVWWVQWKNNLATFLLLTMPFAFYYSVKAKALPLGIVAFLIGLLQGAACVLTLSRGGMLFGALMLGISMLVAVILSKGKRRGIYLVLGTVFLLAAVLAVFGNASVREWVLAKLTPKEDESRKGLFAHAVELFVKYPIFGRGIGYKGPYYHPLDGALYWFHSTPFQIIGSLGLVGVVAYAFQYFVRFKIIFKKRDAFHYFVLLSFVGFELMALVNPGDFVPLPHGVFLVQMFTILEIKNRSKKAA